ncbi:BON domain-containing protein [Pseudomonas sp. GD03842]|uniref:BON domain-containing protein n=1 Tax=unclassified Pseudomonas TaxID=196821 RepID=UPI000D3D6337|nr:MULTISPECIES: BON domain-containing protein [unclassified Pseudomonas]MDH0749332.1 BON domain-containing protein [Pseudomonas sp. GD03842]RAU48419.1 BON domain-containing protein [Pseudomonas sp. RIT 409]RAU54320.1 BON domain-containing protein [Pseudomonas sp. RIT 412]
MYPFKRVALAVTAAGLLGLTPLLAHAAQSDLQAQLTQARQEGSIWTAFALNRHLSPFNIGVKVEQGTATLTGKVENQVDKDLAAQIAGDTQGIDNVDNQLQIDPQVAAEPGTKANMAQRFDDATLVATIKSKLLWNSVTEGLNIEVAAAQGVVTLKGQARDADAKLLAGSLASNTEGVTDVNNLISVSARDTQAIKEQNEAQADSVREEFSDAWITSKVKASLVYSRTLDGLNIKVETKAGVVRLDGVVPNYAEKELAVDIARNIRGVKGVDADTLRVTARSAG